MISRMWHIGKKTNQITSIIFDFCWNHLFSGNHPRSGRVSRVSEWVSGWVEFNVSINTLRSFRRRFFCSQSSALVWQPNQNKQETEHIQMQTTATEKVAIINSTNVLKTEAKRRRRVDGRLSSRLRPYPGRNRELSRRRRHQRCQPTIYVE